MFLCRLLVLVIIFITIGLVVMIDKAIHSRAWWNHWPCDIKGLHDLLKGKCFTKTLNKSNILACKYSHLSSLLAAGVVSRERPLRIDGSKSYMLLVKKNKFHE